jgi:hypothetical protein
VARLGRRKGVRPIFMKFISFLVKLEMLKKTRNLLGSQITTDEDFSADIRNTRSSLNPYLTDDKIFVLRHF